MTTIIVTGGLGFLGSNFLRLWHRRYPRSQIINIDRLTYAGGTDNLEALRDDPVYTEFRLDVADLRRLSRIKPQQPVTIIHFAAETHVDRSLLDAQPFVHTNVLGTHALLQYARMISARRVIIISTDEVYGPTPTRRKFGEQQPLNPANPYAATKAAADLLALACRRTHDLPVIILRSVNVFGPRQYPEKFIPLFTTNALAGKPLPLYGAGEQQRDWLWHEDFCEAVRLLVVARSPQAPIYHIAAGNQHRNLDVARAIIAETQCPPELLQQVADRPGHDPRYALSDSLFRTEFDWRPKMPWRDGLRLTVEWYRTHPEWVRNRRRRSFHEYYRRQYQWRLDG
jgi:dTDP-glucose 4,6-dehydratase